RPRPESRAAATRGRWPRRTLPDPARRKVVARYNTGSPQPPQPPRRPSPGFVSLPLLLTPARPLSDGRGDVNQGRTLRRLPTLRQFFFTRLMVTGECATEGAQRPDLLV